jgi:hypothetical protein
MTPFPIPDVRARRLAALLLLCASSLASQSAPPTRSFTRPDAKFPEGFTAIAAVRELPNGQVIVSDRRDRTLQRLDFATGALEPVGRSGAGPREWGYPGRFAPMRGDTTLMEDFINARFFVINPDGSPGETFRVPDASPAGFPASLIGVDAQGRLIAERVRVDVSNPMGGSIGIIDIVRYDRATHRTDTLGQRREPTGEHSGARQLPGGLLHSFTNLPLAPRDAAVVTTDGRTVVLRHTPYALEVIAPENARRRGPAAAAPAIRVTADEKEAFVRSQIRPGSIVVRDPTGGSALPRPSGSGGTSQRPIVPEAIIAGALDDATMTWPELKPAFVSSSVLAGPDGTVWALRSRAHTDNVPVYDVFGADGRVSHRVALPVGARLVGFGNGVAYLVTTDADDLQYLERHRLP